MYRFNVSEIQDLKSQIILMHTDLYQSSATAKKYHDNEVLFHIKRTTFLNIVSRCLGYTQFSEIKKTAEKEYEYKGRVDLLSLLDVALFKKTIYEMTGIIPEKWIQSALSLVGGFENETYPFVAELCAFTDGTVRDRANEYQPAMQDFPQDTGGLIKYLWESSKYDFSTRLDCFYIDAVGDSRWDVTGYFYSMESMEECVYRLIYKLRAGFLGDSYEYLYDLIGDVEMTKPDDEQIVCFDDEDGIPRKLLIGYCETHNDTPRALFAGGHLKQLRYLAGSMGMPIFDIDDDQFISDKLAVTNMVESAKAIKGYFSNRD